MMTPAQVAQMLQLLQEIRDAITTLNNTLNNRNEGKVL